jgi:hypothetical protein
VARADRTDALALPAPPSGLASTSGVPAEEVGPALDRVLVGPAAIPESPVLDVAPVDSDVLGGSSDTEIGEEQDPALDRVPATQPGPAIPESSVLDFENVRISLNGNDKDERGKHLMALFTDVLPDNPRDIKRMVNNYRLAANILEWSGHWGNLSDVMRERLVLWVVLVVTFPSLASDIAWLCRQPDGRTRDGLGQLRARLESNIQGKKKDLLRLVGLIVSFHPGRKATELLALEKTALALRQTLSRRSRSCLILIDSGGKR